MKMYIKLLVLALMVSTKTQAQRMLPKQKGLELNIGTLSFGNLSNNYSINAALTTNGRNGNYRFLSLDYTYQAKKYEVVYIPTETYTAEGGYSFFMLGDSGRNISLNLGIAAIAGYENINGGETVLYDGALLKSRSGFIYGAGIRLSFEAYLSDQIVFILYGRTKIFWGTDLKQFRPLAGLGLRINF
ncbi:conjugal transfer protein TraO [Elizabethkingia anophelis]|nr:conjugal transfer protein TraO [Elizabethkingia anophelis]